MTSSAPPGAAPPGAGRAITIPDELRVTLYEHALATFPAECCGYLTGPAGGGHVDAMIPCRNAQADGEHPIAPERGAETGFVIAGAELLAFARSFDTERPARIVYHSHTNGRAYFSAIDHALADGPAYPVQHVVIGVASGFAGTLVTEVAQFVWSDVARAYVEIARWEP